MKADVARDEDADVQSDELALAFAMRAQKHVDLEHALRLLGSCVK